MELMVKRFYAEKFAKAKRAADKGLTSFIEDISGMLPPQSADDQDDEGDQESDEAAVEGKIRQTRNERRGTMSQENTNMLLRKLRDMAQTLLVTEAVSLMSGKALKEGARVTWECMWRAMGLEVVATKDDDVQHDPVEKVRGLRNSNRMSINSLATRVKVLSTKLLWIISKMKHRSDYLVRLCTRPCGSST
jgi:hypothetical protein